MFYCFHSFDFFFSSRRRHTRLVSDWSSDVCSSDLFQAGHAAESGVVSAELVALGWDAAQQILEAERGFFHAFGGTFDPGAIMNRLGGPWTFASPGISLKPYPSGSLTHPAMTELARLIAANNIQAAQVEKVDVGANHNKIGRAHV